MNKSEAMPLGTASITFPVYYEDTDFSGFVYHANYLKFFERAREHLIGIAFLKELFQDGVHFVVTHMDIAFRAPAQHGDEIEVTSRCECSGSPRLTFFQEAKVGAKLLVAAKVTLACLGPDNRPMRLPDKVKRRLMPAHS